MSFGKDNDPGSDWNLGQCSLGDPIYEKYGFGLVSQEEKTRLLKTYWSIPERQVETSVVLADRKWLAQR